MQFPRACGNDLYDDEPPFSPRTPTRRPTPSLPTSLYSPRVLFQSQQDVLDFTAQRPHLGSLDLASPILRPMSRSMAPSRRVIRLSIDSAPLTPPLTPESAASTTVSSIISPIELFRFHRTKQPRDQRNDELVTTSVGSHDSWTHGPAVVGSYSHPLSSTDKASEKSAPSFDVLLEASISHEMRSGRFLLVCGVPRSLPSQSLKQAFEPHSDIRGIYVRYQEEHGAVILAFFDTRECFKTMQVLRTSTFFEGHRLEARFISADALRELLPRSEADFVSKGEASLRIVAHPTVDQTWLQNLLSSFGDVSSFSTTGSLGQFDVEYCDCRTTFAAFSQLNKPSVVEGSLRVSFVDPRAQTNALNSLPSCRIPRTPGSELSASRRTPGALHQPRAQQQSQHRSGLHHASSDNNLKDRWRGPLAQGEARGLSHRDNLRDLRRQSSMLNLAGSNSQTMRLSSANSATATILSSDATDSSQGSPQATLVSTPPSSVHSPTQASTVLHYSPSQLEFSHQFYAENGTIDMPASLNSQHVLRYEATPFVPSPTSPLYLSQVAAQTPTHLAPLSFVQRPHLTHIDTTTIESYYSAPSSITPLAVSPTDPGIFNSTDGIFKKSDRDNTIDLEKIEQGLDTRTTVMIKNVPNKMSDKNLLDFINDVCPRRIDFMYLRMDFVNNCNVGYAFVNFITVQDLVTFCRRRRGVKWNMYQSEKVLNMTYANYQGKEALVEKFKNSCIMDERESWRPKIFHSSGPAQGLPELFPDPTHLKRKERSQANARERILYANQTRHSHSRGHGAGRPAASRSPV